MIMNFFMPMFPPTKTQQEHKVKVVNGKPIFYEPRELANARLKIRDSLAAHVPDHPFTGGIELQVMWIFHTDDDKKEGKYRITKPDTDNLQKMLKDEMTKLGFWKDDAQVCCEHIEKFWSAIPGIFIRIEKAKYES